MFNNIKILLIFGIFLALKKYIRLRGETRPMILQYDTADSGNSAQTVNSNLNKCLHLLKCIQLFSLYQTDIFKITF